MTWQHCLDHADSIQDPATSPACLLGVVTYPTDRLAVEGLKRAATSRNLVNRGYVRG